MPHYTAIPTVDQFRKDSSITLAIRSSDPILVRIDDLLINYRTAPEEAIRKLALFDLFLTANFWIDQFTKKRAAFRKERYPAVMALFESVVRELGRMLSESTPHGVANRMREMFGAALGPHGLLVDADPRMNYRPFSKDELVQGRIWFRNGLAMRVQWNDSGLAIRTTHVNSADYFQEVRRQGAGNQLDGYGGFIMTMNREIFMLQHKIARDGGASTFHSSYTDGSPVAMAGTMRIVQGKILAVRTDSGHYQPGVHNLAGLLMALRMYQVDLAGILLQDYAGNAIDTADFFLSLNTDWDRFSQSIKKAKEIRETVYINRTGVLLQKRREEEEAAVDRNRRIANWERRLNLCPTPALQPLYQNQQ